MMHINRRDLLLGLGVASTSLAMAPGFAFAKARKPLRILVLGGTGFIGPHIVRDKNSRES